jgi:hypothetical protein
MAIPIKPQLPAAWANAGARIDPGAVKTELGWVPAEAPPAQFFNYMKNINDSFLTHVNNAGIARWDATTAYSRGSIVSYSLSVDDTRVYQSLADPNTNNIPSTTPASWLDITSQYIKSGYIEAAGVNALSATIDFPKITAYEIGQKFYVKIANDNTSANVNISINGLAAKEIRLIDNSPLALGDLKAGSIAQLIYVETLDTVERFYLLNPFLSNSSNRPGSSVQRIIVERTTLATTTNEELSGITKPLTTDGELLMQATITPKSIGNLLVINVDLPVIDISPLNPGQNASFICTLNVVGETNSRQAAVIHSSFGAAVRQLTFTDFNTTTTLTPLVFTVRFGKGAEFNRPAAIAAVNGVYNGATYIRAFDGLENPATLSIEEIQV